MLSSLRIKNLALVEDLNIEFEPGYVAITGETGAGKSILIGALNLLLGARADRTWLRAGTESGTVEAVFDIRRLAERVRTVLDQHGIEPCDDSQLLIKRSVTLSGANRQFVNGTPVTLQALASLGDLLVDLHGPHDHQSLLHPALQLELLDAFGGCCQQCAEVESWIDRRANILLQRTELGGGRAERERELDLLRHQVHEIETSRLRAGEEQELEPELHRAANAARLVELGRRATGLLAEDDDSLLDRSAQLGRSLQDLKKVDPEAECLASLHEQAVSFWNDLRSDLSGYLEKIDLDPERLAQLQSRMDHLNELKRKFGRSVEDVIEFGLEARKRLATLEGRDETLARLQIELEAADASLMRLGLQLSKLRLQAAPRLAAAVNVQLSELGFRGARFEIAIRSAESAADARRTGLDTVEFQFAPNVGEPLKPLRAIGSSGEMARVMLALKAVLAEQDSVPVLVFDEVDANVGGETASRVGEKMRQIGRHRQVLCITHLAPVAAKAAGQLRVQKIERGGRTITEAKHLDRTERVEELARMLGGLQPASRQHAEALLDVAKTL